MWRDVEAADLGLVLRVQQPREIVCRVSREVGRFEAEEESENDLVSEMGSGSAAPCPSPYPPPYPRILGFRGVHPTLTAIDLRATRLVASDLDGSVRGRVPYTFLRNTFEHEH